MTKQITKLPLTLTLLLAPLFVPGCDQKANPIVGGTPGSLYCGGLPMREMQVNVFRSDAAGFTQIGVGYVTNDGSFELVAADARGPLVLQSGTYHFTIESIGAEVQIPPIYLDPKTTPIIQTYVAGDPVELRLPLFQGIKG